MARNEVAEKIEDLITSEVGSWKEPEAVYLFVELRKFLDHAREETQNTKNPTYTIECSWHNVNVLANWLPRNVA